MCVEIWQTIGTWFAGIALAFFACLTWRLSCKRDKLLLDPRLSAYPISLYPKIGWTEWGSVEYRGIIWGLGLANPGNVGILIREISIYVVSTEAQRSRVVGPPFCKLWVESEDKELKPPLWITLSSHKIIRILLHGQGLQEEILGEIAGSKRIFKLEAHIKYEVTKRGSKIKEESVLSEEFHIGENEDLEESKEIFHHIV